MYLQLFNNKEFFTVLNSKRFDLSSSHLQWRHRCDWQIHKYRWYRIQSKNVEGSCHKKSFWSDIVPRLSQNSLVSKIKYWRSECTYQNSVRSLCFPWSVIKLVLTLSRM